MPVVFLCQSLHFHILSIIKFRKLNTRSDRQILCKLKIFINGVEEFHSMQLHYSKFQICPILFRSAIRKFLFGFFSNFCFYFYSIKFPRATYNCINTFVFISALPAHFYRFVSYIHSVILSTRIVRDEDKLC